jgi:hypothetical protein
MQAQQEPVFFVMDCDGRGWKDKQVVTDFLSDALQMLGHRHGWDCTSHSDRSDLLVRES